tara:strand:+ start:300 stop:719 length:420 start_codon:yes stop_codon:yes gene_type:complete
MKKLLVIIVLSFLFSGNAISDEKKTYVLNNLQEDFTTCYTYFKIAEEGLSRGKNVDEKTIAGLRRSSEISLQSAYLVGEELNMKIEAMKARVKMSFEKMQKEIGSDFINFSVILDKYAYYCKEVIEKPEERMIYWENKY